MKNIVWLITDTFRYDNLRDRATRPVRTPNLNEFAATRASAMESCWVSSFPTIPHRTDLATGTLGWPHYGWQPIDLSGPNHVASLLSSAGYATQLICDCPHLFNSRFNLAFDAACQLRGQEGDRPLLRLNDPIASVVSPDKTRTRPAFRGHPLVDVHRWTNRYGTCEADTFPARTGATAIRWLEENYRAGPFFLWVDLFDPHEPWDAPEYLVRRYDPGYAGQPMMHPNYGPASAYTAAELRNLWAHYAAEAELVDRWIGRVLEKVDDLGLWEDSIVVVTTDHGMSLGEHDRTGKSNIHDADTRYWPIYPEIGHIPFLAAGAGIPAGGSFEAVVQPPDILPTVAELAGVKLEPPKPFEGSSFAPVLRDGAEGPRRCAVSGCHIRSDSGGIPRKATTPFVVSGKWGYAPVGALGRPELYDLTLDPLAENDVIEHHGSEAVEVHRMFLEHLRAHGASDESIALWDQRDAASGRWAVDYADR